MSAPAIATLSADRAEVTLKRGPWAGSFPVADLPAQLAFYRGMVKRHARREVYAADVAALERVQKLLAILGPDHA